MISSNKQSLPPVALEYAAPGAARRSAIAFLTGPAFRATAALLLVLLIGIGFNADGAFFKVGTHRDTLRQASVTGILACGMTMVIISGGIDLAVGSVLALTAVTFALTTIHWGWSPWLSLPVCVLFGAFCGGTSGVIEAKFRVQPFIATLAMMVFARGLTKAISGGEKVALTIRTPDGGFKYVDVPAIFRAIDARVLGGNVAVVTLIMLSCAAVAWLLLARHRWGRQLYAIGGNEEAARLSGVPVRTAKVLAYAMAGAMAAVAGICQAAQEQQGDPEAGTGYELTAIAMVVVGGTTLSGGRGGIGLTLLGVLTIGYLDKILSINAVSEAGRLMLTGMIIVVAVLAQGRRRT